MTKEEKEFLEVVKAQQIEAAEKAFEKAAPKEEFEKSMEKVHEAIKNFEGSKESIDALKKEFGEFSDGVVKFMEIYETEKASGFGGRDVNALSKAIDEMLENPKFKALVDNNSLSTTGKLYLKGISLENSVAGNITLTEQSGVVIAPPVSNVNMRDVVSTIEGDPQYTRYVGQEVIEVDRQAAFLSENGALPKSSFKLKEYSVDANRVGTAIPISRTMLRSKIYVKNWLLVALPDEIKSAENLQMLLGDGTGSNMTGIMSVAPKLEESIGASFAVVAADGIVSVETANEGKATLVHFDKPLPRGVRTGQKATFALFANAAYNTEVAVTVMNSTTIQIPIAYTAQSETECKKATMSVKSRLYKSVKGVNGKSIIKAGISHLSVGGYRPTSVAMNPDDKFTISEEKDSMGRNLDLIQTINGVDYIAGLPIVELDSMPTGKFILGDFKKGAKLITYGGLRIEFAEDVQTKLENNVMVIADEEILFAIDNKFAFAVGDFDACRAILSV